MSSQFSIYGIGQVANDIDGSETWDVEVFPLEIIPSTSGTLETQESKAREFKDASGKSYSYSVTSSNTITATWLPFGAYNRATAPCVRKGEYVILFRYAGEDQYFWVPLFMEADLRKKERAIWFFSNKEKSTTELSNLQSQGYYFKVDTIDQQVQLHTDDSQGEACGYDIIIDTTSGTFLIEDTLGNSINLDSAGGILSITLNNDLTITSGNDVNLTAKNIKGTLEQNVELNLDKLSVTNSTGELISILSDVIQAIIDEMHIGNLGVPTKLHPSSAAKFSELKSKLDSFKK